MQWYYADKTGQQVKAQEAELSQLVATGKIEATTLVWNANLPDWQPASSALPDLFKNARAGVVNPSVGGVTPIYNQPNPTSGLQIASLVCGILSFMCTGPITGIPAVICGHMARSKQKALTQSTEGTGMALAGLILGYVGTVLITAGLIIGIILGSIEASYGY